MTNNREKYGNRGKFEGNFVFLFGTSAQYKQTIHQKELQKQQQSSTTKIPVF